MQSVTYFQAWSFHVHPEQATMGSNNFMDCFFTRYFSNTPILHTVPFVESDLVAKKPTLQCLFIVLRSLEHIAQLVIQGSDVILWQSINIKMLLLLQKKIAHHCEQTLSAFWLMKGLLKLFYLMHPGHNWGHHLL